MDREDAKRELRPIKEMDADIKAVELEIERLMTVATKMTTSFEPVVVSSTPGNRTEDALIQVEEYRSRLSSLLLESIRHKNKCIEKVRKIEPKSLQKILIYYYFQNLTMEKTAEVLDRSYQWTYEMYKTALDKYCEISDLLDSFR